MTLSGTPLNSFLVIISITLVERKHIAESQMVHERICNCVDFDTTPSFNLSKGTLIKGKMRKGLKCGILFNLYLIYSMETSLSFR